MPTGGGLKAIRSVFHYARKIGPLNLWQALHSKNACKACAFGTGGQNGGIHNETGRGIEFCNKNIQAHLSDSRQAIPNTRFFEHSIDELSRLDGKALEELGRLATPLYKSAADRHYRPISYREALDTVVDRFRHCAPERSFFYASGRSSNEAAYLLQLMARLYGTNNINNCSYYCHQASGVALNDSVGTGTATVEYTDIDKADLVFVFGANPASNHPRFVKSLLKLRRRGGHVVVINPAKETGMVRFASPSDWHSMLKGGESVASVYVQPHLGGDIAFMHALGKYLIENNALDDLFIDNHTEGFIAYRDAVQALSWSDLIEQSGVDKETIEKVASLYHQSERCIFTWSMGLTHHLHGVNNIQTLSNIALLRGMIGKPGAGLLPLRGHSNIQGMGSMGFTPKLKSGVEEALRARLGDQLPSKPGLDTMSCMEASARGEMDCALMLGGNLLASNPDFNFARDALNQIPFKVFLNPTINLSHVHGVDGEVLILPMRARDEEKQATTQESMFNFVRLSDGGIDRFPQLLSEVEMVIELAKELIDKKRFDFAQMSNHQRIREWIAETVPGFAKMQNIDESKQEFHIDGRILHTPQFATPNGRAQFRYHSAPHRPSGTLMLTSVRSEGQFNSIIYHTHDSYRGQSERNVVMINPADMKRLGLREDQLVDLRSDTGRLANVKVRPFDIKPGNIMTYYPEANILVPKQVDEHSRTPAFKSVPVRIETSSSTNGATSNV